MEPDPPKIPNKMRTILVGQDGHIYIIDSDVSDGTMESISKLFREIFRYDYTKTSYVKASIFNQ